MLDRSLQSEPRRERKDASLVHRSVARDFDQEDCGALTASGAGRAARADARGQRGEGRSAW